MTYKVFLVGMLFLSAQTLFAADAVSDAENQSTQSSTEQSGDKPTQPKDTQVADNTSKSAGTKPATEESEPDCD